MAGGFPAVHLALVPLLRLADAELQRDRRSWAARGGRGPDVDAAHVPERPARVPVPDAGRGRVYEVGLRVQRPASGVELCLEDDQAEHDALANVGSVVSDEDGERGEEMACRTTSGVMMSRAAHWPALVGLER